MFFVAYPIVYQKGKGYNAGITGLMFIRLAIGVVLSATCAPLVNKHYLKLCEKAGGKPAPEARLIPMLWSCWCIPVDLFVFAWTSYPHVHWIGPAIGGFPIGFRFIFLYNACNNYPSTHTSIKLPLLLLRRLSYVRYGERACFYSRIRCTTGWVMNGQARFLRSLPWRVAQSPSSSTSVERRSGNTHILRTLVMKRMA